ncbi:hypothetical protein [Flavobacterium franklandianum]|nr:hypothetical protein [Flavobacterium franklandianum]
MELSKTDKKIARIPMDKGIEICNASVIEILTDWKNGKKNMKNLRQSL